MVGVVGHYILQPMARTNHKFPKYSGRALQKEAKPKVHTPVSRIMC